MALTEKSLLKHFDEFISNEYYGLVDFEISHAPSVNRENVIKSMKEKIVKLEKLRTQLEEILNAK